MQFRKTPRKTLPPCNWHASLRKLFIITILFLFGIFHQVEKAAAQIEPPDREFLFFEDREKKKKDHKRDEQIRDKQKKAKDKQRKDLPFDINAPNIDFDSAQNSVHASGGLIISYGTAIMEAERGDFNVQTHEADLSGDVRLSDLSGDLLADSAKLNLDTGKGTLTNTTVNFAQGSFRVKAAEAKKVGPEDYEFKDATLTTCNCPDDEDCRPWSIRATDAEITRNGYGQIWNGTIAVRDVPVFYVPYLLFPAKTERQTGLLPATFGNSNTYGFEYFQPLFLAIDRSTDATLTYVLQSSVRTGIETEFRKVFSRNNRIDLGMTYLDEMWRDEGDLLGTDVTGIFDPEIKEQRFAGYMDASFRGDVAGHPVQFLVDGNYVNDNLLLREFEQTEVGEPNSRFVSSRAVARTDLLDTYTAELSARYDRGLVDNQDVLFQELPTLDVLGVHVFRPFGENPLGAKVVLQNELTSTDFWRDVGYDGFRHELYEEAKVPFHVQNYVDFEVGGDVRGSIYDLDNREKVDNETGKPLDEELLDQSSDRIVPGLNFKASTIMEKIFDVGEGNIFKTLAELGQVGRGQQLVRLKHTLEPVMKYRFVPEVDQDDTPQFDSYDHLDEKSLLTYGLVQRFYGRFEPRDRYLYGIEETTPELRDIPNLQSETSVDESFDFGLDQGGGHYGDYSRGLRQELATLGITQSYDINEERDNKDDERSAFSDVGVLATLLPNEYFRVGAGTNLNVDNTDFDSYGVETQLLDKRGDEIRARLSFVKESFRQLEGGVQLTLTDRLKLGYYTRYDDFTGEFIENKFGVRLRSQCNRCWTVDVVFSDKTNPNETDVLVTLTLLGIGELRDKFLTGQLSDRDQGSGQSS